MSLDPGDMLIDPETGLIIGVSHRELHYCERPLHLWNCRLADGRRSVGTTHDRVSAGCGFDKGRARGAAIGEAVERYCGNIRPRGLRSGSRDALAAEGHRLIELERVELYSSRQYGTPGFSFRPLSPGVPMSWVAATEWPGGESILVPASLVLLNPKDLGRSETCTNFVMFAGIACGVNAQAAALSGLLEAIERDATTIWWMTVERPAAIDPGLWPEAVAAFGEESFASGRLKLFDLTTEFAVPTIGALLFEPRLETALMGFATRPEPFAAARKAFAEAAQLLTMAAALLDADSPVWRSAEAGIVHRSALASYRADRNYVAGFRPDFRDMTDLFHHCFYYLDPAAQAALAPFRSAPATLPPPRSFAGDPAEAVTARGWRVYHADLTTVDVRNTGLSVIRTLVPGLVPNAPAAFPYLGCSRLYDAPLALGWARHRLGAQDLRYAPLPHS
jgi:ribosomal protein S12 methylthiotransferase accessory factor